MLRLLSLCKMVMRIAEKSCRFASRMGDKRFRFGEFQLESIMQKRSDALLDFFRF